MTVKYLLTPLTPKTVNLYGFPWDFMAWAFEAIHYLRQQVNYQKEVFCPRILRWLSAKTDKNAKFLNVFNPPKEAIVHPWLVLTNRELKMPIFLTLWSVQTLPGPKVIDRIKMKLFGATTITRKIILEGGLLVVDYGSGSGSGAVVEVNVTVEATTEGHNITVYNPSTASKEEEKVDPVSSGKWKNYPFKGFNISDEAPKKLTKLINDNSKWIADGLLKNHVGKKQNDEHYKVNESSLGFDIFDFVYAHPGIKNWFYLMSQPQTCWNDKV
ncbi:hypothetical protein BC332_18182 [Capsicum chinense]|nr:hypothetical protein BC332_18182 [Capsicum chinense]